MKPCDGLKALEACLVTLSVPFQSLGRLAIWLQSGQPWSRGSVPGRNKRLNFSITTRSVLGLSYTMGTDHVHGDRGVKLTTHHHLKPSLRIVELYLHFPYSFLA
jgi:hypothetical protein